MNATAVGAEKVSGYNMRSLINILFWTALMTYSFNTGKAIPIILCLIGFLVMQYFCDELDDQN